MKPRFVLAGFVAATLVLHGVVAWLAPISSDDWDQLVFAYAHRHDAMGDWLAAWFARHFTLADATSYLIVRHPIAHAIVTPLLALAVVWGTFALAARRLPRWDAWGDVAAIVVIAALIWIGAPRCGLTYFHRPYAATWLCGTAFTLWFFVPLRCTWRVRGGWIALLALVGFLAATSTRQFGIVLVLATLYTIKQRRERWLWILLAAVAAGAVVGFYRATFDFRGFRPGVELSMVALNLPIFEGGELISLVGGLVLAKIVVGTMWPRYATRVVPDTHETLRWFGVWVAYIVISLLGPRYSEATVFAATVILCIAVFPVVRWVMASRPMAIAVVAIAVGIHLVAWSMAVSTYVPIAAEFEGRMAAVKAAPKTTVATVKTYAQIRPSFWAYGEDWNDAARRQFVAASLFRLEDIALSPAFRRLEVNPKLELRLVADGVTPEALRAAGAPERWAGTIKTARAQFADVVRGLRGAGQVRLVVDHLPLDFLRGRELVAATADLVPKINRRSPDDESKQAILVSPASLVARYPETYTVIGGRATPVTFARGRFLIQTLTTELHAVVACNAERCFLVDAFIPSL